MWYLYLVLYHPLEINLFLLMVLYLFLPKLKLQQVVSQEDTPNFMCLRQHPLTQKYPQ
jgi:hypothetical protein